jgi:type I restriction enzyme R subunit
MAKFTEQELENAIIQLFEQQGYTHVRGDTIHRKFDDILLEEDLRA